MATYISPVSGDWAGNRSNLFVAHRTRKGGGERYHAGNDLHAKNGTKAYATIGGTVLYTGDNTGYNWNATVLGDDGNIYRYATHGPLSVVLGQRVEQGQAVGTIAEGHLHFEVIPPISPAYDQMVANPGTFIDTQWYPGGKPLSVNPAVFFGIKPGTRITAGQEIGTIHGSQELAIASFTAANQSPEQIAALQRTLAEQGTYKGPIDGIWGRGTQAGFEQYATANGVPGGTTVAAPPEPVDPVTQKLAAMMLTENRGGGDRGMTDVGSVALNRVRDTSGKWADDLDGVLNKNHFAIRPLSSFTPEEQARALDIAAKLQAGDITDTTGGATSFVTHGATPRSDWAADQRVFRSTRNGIDYYGQGQFDDTEVAAAAPTPAAPQVAFAEARTKDEALPAASAAFADLPPETVESVKPASTRSITPATPTAPLPEARTKDATYKPVLPPIRDIPGDIRIGPPPFDTRAKDDAYNKAAHTPITDIRAIGSDFAPITGRDPLTGASAAFAPPPPQPAKSAAFAPVPSMSLASEDTYPGRPGGRSSMPLTSPMGTTEVQSDYFNPLNQPAYLAANEFPSEYQESFDRLQEEKANPFHNLNYMAGSGELQAPKVFSQWVNNPAAFAAVPVDATQFNQRNPLTGAPLTDAAFAPPPNITKPAVTPISYDPGIALATPATAVTAATHRPVTPVPAKEPPMSLLPLPENVAKTTEPVADTTFPTPAVKKDPLKGVGKGIAKTALTVLGGPLGALASALIFNNSGGKGLFSGFGGPQVFTPTEGGPSGTFPGGYNYQRGTGIQGENSTQFTNNGRTYTYTDQDQWGQPSIGGWSK